MHTRIFGFQGLRNDSFSESFAYVRNGSFLNFFRPSEKSFDTVTFFKKIFANESIS